MSLSIKDFIKFNEGLRLKPYRCTAGKLTIGYGRNIEEVGITEDEAEGLLNNDINLAIYDLKKIFPDLDTFPRDVITALVDMRFNLGPGRFRKFKKMIEAVKSNDYELAAAEAKDSLWYNQVGLRAERVCKLLAGEGFI
jgi:lysozyme